MKKPIIFLLSFLLFTTGFAQQTGRIGSHNTPTSWNPSVQANFAAASEAKQYAQQIVAVVGLKPNFEMMPARVDNAAAVTYAGKRYVLYNPDFINGLVQKTGNKWAAVSVLAHEIGHHLNGHTVTRNGSHPSTELEADEFSGFVLRKMGASLTDAQAAMKLLAGVTASRTHPAQYDRLTSIERGWQQAAGNSMQDVAVTTPSKAVPVQPPVYEQRSVQRQPVERPVAQSIIGTVRFNANPAERYFVTDNYQLVQVQNRQVKSIARLARSNSSRFPYVIYDEQNNQLLVSAQGAIITKSGKEVGSMQAYKG
jgi:ribosomal protein S19